MASPYLGLGLGDVVTADLDPGLEESLGHLVDVDAQQVGHLLSDGVVGKNGLDKKDSFISFKFDELK